MNAHWKQTAVRRLIQRARNGDSWAAIGLEFYPSSGTRKQGGSNALQLFARYATAEDWAARRAALARLSDGERATLIPFIWTDPGKRAELIRRALTGEAWPSIGADFYPGSTREQAAKTAAQAFSRFASESDKETRGQALRSRNFNRLPGLSDRAERRRRQRGLDDVRVVPIAADPFAGMGDCFG